MSKFYVNYYKNGNSLLVKEYDSKTGKENFFMTDIKPKLYKECGFNTGWKTVNDKPVEEMRFNSIYDAMKRIKFNNGDVLYGMDSWDTQTLYDIYPDNIEFNKSLLKICSLDIEVFSGLNGVFPEPMLAYFPITMITIRMFNTNKAICFTLTDYKHNKNDEYVGGIDATVLKFNTEEELLHGFVKVIEKYRPDIITTWNGESFDMPYIVNRLIRLEKTHDYIQLNDLLDTYPRNTSFNGLKEENFYLRLSPWKIVTKTQKVDKYMNKYDRINIVGITHLDYMHVYKKFNFKTKTSYSLDHIAEHEVSANKIKYKSSSINHFFVEEPEEYTKYNIRDADLICQIDNRIQYINIVLTIAYMAKCSYDDTLGTVKAWDSLLYGMLTKRGYVVPLKAKKDKIAYPGAYVKLPTAGKYKWVLGTDFNSLYPHIYMMWNIGMETLVRHEDLPEEIKENLLGITWIDVPDSYKYEYMSDYDDVFDIDSDSDDSKEKPVLMGIEKLLSKSVDLSLLKKYNLTMAANNTFYRTDRVSIFSEKVEEIYSNRKKTQNQMKSLKVELEENKDLWDKKEIDNVKGEIERLDGIQMAYKIFMNSLYGATGTPYFRWFENDIAAATTACGQLAVQWVEQRVTVALRKIAGDELLNPVIYCDTDSIKGDSTITINEKSVKIEDYYNSLEDCFMTEDDHNENWTKLLLDDHYTQSFDMVNGKRSRDRVEYVKKHKVKKRMFKVMCEGVEVTITEDHGLIVNRHGCYITIKPTEVEEGDLLIRIVEQCQ